MNFGSHRGNRGISNIAQSYHARWRAKEIGSGVVSLGSKKQSVADFYPVFGAATTNGRPEGHNPASKVGGKIGESMPESEVKNRVRDRGHCEA